MSGQHFRKQSEYLSKSVQVRHYVLREPVFLPVAEMDYAILKEAFAIRSQQLRFIHDGAIGKIRAANLDLERRVSFAALYKNNIRIDVEQSNDRINLRFRRIIAINIDGETISPKNPGDLASGATMTEGIGSLPIPLKHVVLSVFESADSEAKTLKPGNQQFHRAGLPRVLAAHNV
jgi:hypothetical protein